MNSIYIYFSQELINILKNVSTRQASFSQSFSALYRTFISSDFRIKFRPKFGFWNALCAASCDCWGAVVGAPVHVERVAGSQWRAAWDKCRGVKVVSRFVWLHDPRLTWPQGMPRTDYSLWCFVYFSSVIFHKSWIRTINLPTRLFTLTSRHAPEPTVPRDAVRPAGCGWMMLTHHLKQVPAEHQRSDFGIAIWVQTILSPRSNIPIFVVQKPDARSMQWQPHSKIWRKTYGIRNTYIIALQNFDKESRPMSWNRVFLGWWAF